MNSDAAPHNARALTRLRDPVLNCPREGSMLQTVEAMIDETGNVRLLEPLHLSPVHRALVTILHETQPRRGLRNRSPQRIRACRRLESPQGGRSVVPLAAALVVLVRFPFFDLSRTKLRPAVVPVNAGRGDWILCQVTGKPCADNAAVVLEAADFQRGSLQVTSYARAGKLFTASGDLLESVSRSIASGIGPRGDRRGCDDSR